MAGEDFAGVLGFAEDVVDVFEAGEVAGGEAFLVGDEEVGGFFKGPEGEGAFEVDDGIRAAEGVEEWGEVARGVGLDEPSGIC